MNEITVFVAALLTTEPGPIAPINPDSWMHIGKSASGRSMYLDKQVNTDGSVIFTRFFSANSKQKRFSSYTIHSIDIDCGNRLYHHKSNTEINLLKREIKIRPTGPSSQPLEFLPSSVFGALCFSYKSALMISNNELYGQIKSGCYFDRPNPLLINGVEYESTWLKSDCLTIDSASALIDLSLRNAGLYRICMTGTNVGKAAQQLKQCSV